MLGGRALQCAVSRFELTLLKLEYRFVMKGNQFCIKFVMAMVVTSVFGDQVESIAMSTRSEMLEAGSLRARDSSSSSVLVRTSTHFSTIWDRPLTSIHYSTTVVPTAPPTVTDYSFWAMPIFYTPDRKSSTTKQVLGDGSCAAFVDEKTPAKFQTGTGWPMYGYTCDLFSKEDCKGPGIVSLIYVDANTSYEINKAVVSLRCRKNPINSASLKPAPLGG